MSTTDTDPQVWAEGLNFHGTIEAGNKEEGVIIVSHFDDFFGEQRYALWKEAPWKRRGGGWEKETDTIMWSTVQAWIENYDMHVFPGGHLSRGPSREAMNENMAFGVITVGVFVVAVIVIFMALL